MTTMEQWLSVRTGRFVLFDVITEKVGKSNFYYLIEIRIPTNIRKCSYLEIDLPF